MPKLFRWLGTYESIHVTRRFFFDLLYQTCLIDNYTPIKFDYTGVETTHNFNTSSFVPNHVIFDLVKNPSVNYYYMKNVPLERIGRTPEIVYDMVKCL